MPKGYRYGNKEERAEAERWLAQHATEIPGLHRGAKIGRRRPLLYGLTPRAEPAAGPHVGPAEASPYGDATIHDGLSKKQCALLQLEAHGQSQRQISKLTGVTQQAVSRMSRRARRSLRRLRKAGRAA